MSKLTGRNRGICETCKKPISKDQTWIEYEKTLWKNDAGKSITRKWHDKCGRLKDE